MADCPPKLKDLVYELKAVDWHDLGIQLDVPPHILKNIGKENPTEARKLSEVLQYWLNNGEAHWKQIVKALKRIGNHGNIIRTIESEYLELPPSHQTEMTPQQQQRFKTVTLHEDQVLGKAEAKLSATDLTRLNERDHHTKLFSQLKIHAAKWRDIGTYLGFRQGELDIIQSRPMTLMQAPVSHLNEMLSVWFQWAPNDGRGSKDFATLGALKSAMNEVGLGRSAAGLTI